MLTRSTSLLLMPCFERNGLILKQLNFDHAKSISCAKWQDRTVCALLIISGVRSLLSQMFNWGRREDGGSDLINLCATFGSDPFVSSFAQVSS